MSITNDTEVGDGAKRLHETAQVGFVSADAQATYVHLAAVGYREHASLLPLAVLCVCVCVCVCVCLHNTHQETGRGGV